MAYFYVILSTREKNNRNTYLKTANLLCTEETFWWLRNFDEMNLKITPL